MFGERLWRREFKLRFVLVGQRPTTAKRILASGTLVSKLIFVLLLKIKIVYKTKEHNYRNVPG